MNSAAFMGPNSVGLAQPQWVEFNHPLQLQCGQALSHYHLVYETYGQLNFEHSNAVLICHALSGSHHAAGYHSPQDKKPGWWDVMIGPGKPIDTNKFFVVCVNNIGGCHGSTGPNTVNLETSLPYGPDFPIVTVKDWVNTQAELAAHLKIERWRAVIGGSLGGMQVMQWAIDRPQQLDHAIIIASAAKLSAQNIAFNEIARQAILADPHFHDGHYYGQASYPKHGLSLARMLGHVTYLSEPALREKFGRELKSGQYHFNYDAEFSIENYLRYQGENFSGHFDANTYLLMTKALDYFDPAADFHNDLAEAFAQATCRFLVVSFSTDWRFSPQRSEEIVNALVHANKSVSYANINAPQGHDSFLLKIPRYIDLMRAYLERL